MLVREALDLCAYLERTPQVSLKDLASTLAAELQPTSSRLAVVAGSAADLQARLKRAADRLADPRCRFLKDSAGLYYFSEPLYRQGSVALLFPGEGAQYLNMLADLLPHFPEMAEASSEEWHAFLDQVTGFSTPLDEQNATAFDRWRQALAAIDIPVWTITPAAARAMAARGEELAQRAAVARAAQARLARDRAADVLRDAPSGRASG